MNIDHLTLDELYQLNQHVCDRIDDLIKQHEQAALALLCPGMTVQFIGNDGIITGILLKKQRKNVIIEDIDKTKRYKVAVSMVKPVYGPKA